MGMINFYKGSYENLVSKALNFQKIDNIYLTNNNDLYFCIEEAGRVNKDVENPFLNDNINEIYGFNI